MSSAVSDRESGSTSDLLSVYLHEIRAYRLLRRGEEAELARRIHQGDEDALQRLVCANLRFVVTIARKYQHQGISLADLISEGNLGLLRAAERFDPNRGVKFISYAVWWIRQGIMQALAEHAHAVRVPVSRTSVLRRIGREANALRQELGRDPTNRELADRSDVSERELAATMPLRRVSVSLDAPVGDDDDANLLDYLPDDATPGTDVRLGEDALAESLDAALHHLRPREAQVLRWYFGFAGGDAMTLESIAERMGITRERVRQIKEKALWRLRTSKQAQALASFCDR